MDPSKPESLKKKKKIRQASSYDTYTHAWTHTLKACVGRNQWKQSIAEMCYKQQQKASQ